MKFIKITDSKRVSQQQNLAHLYDFRYNINYLYRKTFYTPNKGVAFLIQKNGLYHRLLIFGRSTWENT